MRRLLLAAIRFYQRYLSPHKGFRCAYHAHTGRRSCSKLGYRAVQLHGAMAGLMLLRERMYLCGVAHRRYTPPLPRPHYKQRGDCDIGCDGCDMPSCNVDFCDIDGCDNSKNKRKSKGDEDAIHLPPKSEG